MKKIIASCLLIIMCITALLGLSGCSDYLNMIFSGDLGSFKIIFNGRNIVGDTLPIVQDDEVFYPLNDFCDVIDATYKYSPYENKITLHDHQTKIEIFSEKDIISIDDIRGKLEKRPIMQDGIIFIPLKAVATAFGYNAELKSNKLVITEVLDLITKKTEQNHTTYYEYDKNGNLLTETSDDYCYTYTYDENGKLLAVSDQDNEIIESYEYNDKGRVTEAKVSGYIVKFDDRGNMLYNENRDGGTETGKFDNNNNLLYMEIQSSDSDEKYICTYTYDDEGRLIYKKETGKSPKTYTYTYDKHIIVEECVPENGIKLTNIQDYNGKTLMASTDQINKIEEIKSTENAVEFITNMGKRKYLFNDLNQVIEEEWDGSISYKLVYTYDEYGNLLMTKEDDRIIESYTYNDLGMVTEHSLYDRIVKKCEYNDGGKITYFEDEDGNSIRYTYDEANNLVCKEAESNGDLIEKYIFKRVVSVPVSYRSGITICEYMTVKR